MAATTANSFTLPNPGDQIALIERLAEFFRKVTKACRA